MVSASDDDKGSMNVKGKQAKPKTTKKVAKKKTAKKAVAKKKVAKKHAAKTSAPRKPRTSKADMRRISARERYEMIARMAYFRAEKRNFEPGWEQQDWFESEKIVDEMLNRVIG